MDASTQQYGRFALTLHWVVAACIVFALAFGLSIEEEDAQSLALTLHKSFGITIFVLAVVRLIWRIGHRPPPLPAHMSRLQRAAATVTHVLLYMVIFALPVTGYIAVAARGRETTYFGAFDVPNVAPLSRALSHQAMELHEIGQWLLYVLLVAHIGATAYHQIILKDGLLYRMWPRRRPSADAA